MASALGYPGLSKIWCGGLVMVAPGTTLWWRKTTRRCRWRWHRATRRWSGRWRCRSCPRRPAARRQVICAGGPRAGLNDQFDVEKCARRLGFHEVAPSDRLWVGVPLIWDSFACESKTLRSLYLGRPVRFKLGPTVLVCVLSSLLLCFPLWNSSSVLKNPPVEVNIVRSQKRYQYTVSPYVAGDTDDIAMPFVVTNLCDWYQQVSLIIASDTDGTFPPHHKTVKCTFPSLDSR